MHERANAAPHELPVERLLDGVVQEILAETARSRGPRPPDPDPVARFLADAAAFLDGREDAAALIDALRRLVLPPPEPEAEAPPPEPPAC